MNISHQPFDGTLGDTLIDRLGSGEYHQLEFMVAFAKQSGVLRLKGALEAFRENGGVVSAFIGIDMNGTSSEALATLLTLTDELHVVHTESPMQTFHSKVYSLTAKGTVWVTVGSNNLTYPGLWSSFETWATEVLDVAIADDAARAAALSDRFVGLRDTTARTSMKISTEKDVAELLGLGYIKTEYAINVGTRSREKAERSGRRLFASAVPHSKGPALPPGSGPSTVTSTSTSTSTSSSVATGTAMPAPVPAVLAEWVGEVFWAESGAMTSAARNQLDLSMSGRVITGDAVAAGYGTNPGSAVGSVSFFGVDPTMKSDSRSITLNYLGVDYDRNRVYFPDSDDANGTWRIQLNGANDQGVRLDHHVGRDGFVRKVLAFQRIDEDYYSFTILEANQLKPVAAASSFSAKNGGAWNGKLYGVLTAVE